MEKNPKRKRKSEPEVQPVLRAIYVSTAQSAQKYPFFASSSS